MHKKNKYIPDILKPRYILYQTRLTLCLIKFVYTARTACECAVQALYFMQISRELVRHVRQVRWRRCRGNRVYSHLISRAQPLLYLLYLASEAANQPH